jgi:hypothetical protein
MGYEPLLDTVSQEIAETVDLSRLLFADRDGLIASAPDCTLSVVEPVDLQSEIGVHVPHEVGELLGIVDRQEEMEVRGHEDCGMDTDRNLCLGLAQDASDDFVQRRARPEEELGLESPDRHLYERAPIGYKAHTSGHALYKDEKGRRMSFQNKVQASS